MAKPHALTASYDIAHEPCVGGIGCVAAVINLAHSQESGLAASVAAGVSGFGYNLTAASTARLTPAQAAPSPALPSRLGVGPPMTEADPERATDGAAC